ncbi:rod shape-determining protein MreC [Patescibacteria group bacterium]|nr:rod shape-determining protein MreC [Patescibacteria group bacterium]
MNSRKKNFYSWSFLLIIALIGLHYIGLLAPIENSIAFVLRPVSSGLHSLSTSIARTYLNFSTKKNLINEVDRLVIEYNLLKKENQRLKLLEEENSELKSLLNYSKQKEGRAIFSNIISKPRTLSYSGAGVIIDKGIKDGIIEGLAVVNSSGMLLGKIVKVSNNISEVCLITEKDCEFAVMGENSHQTSGITIGELNLITKMNYIPQTETINLMDTIITSGLESTVPPGIIVGRVIQIFQKSNDVWKSAIIEPSSDINKASIVSIILP